MKYISMLLFMMVLASCSGVESPAQQNAAQGENSSEIQNISPGSDTSSSPEIESVELDIKDSEIVYITLDGENTSSDDAAVQISGQQVTLKKSGNYELTGTLSGGQIVVETDDEKAVQITLNNVDITSSQGSAFVVENANQTIITLADNSINNLEDGSAYSLDQDGPSAAISSKDDLVIRGSGVLNVIANFNDGISSNDDVYITGGTINITSADDAIRGKNLLSISGGDITISANEDGLKSNNEESGKIEISGGNIEISAGDDAITANKEIVINGGNIDILSSYEGLESESIVINSGYVGVVSSDDAINITASSDDGEPDSLTINGGTLIVDTNGDGLDSNGDIIMTGGDVIIYGPTQDNNGALDYDGDFYISGGSLIALGSSGMSEAPSEGSDQNSVIFRLDTSYSSGAEISLIDENDREIFSLSSLKDFQALVFSSSDVVEGNTYFLHINGTQIEQVTISGSVTTVGEPPTRGRN